MFDHAFAQGHLAVSRHHYARVAADTEYGSRANTPA
jgi:hypothetical protein